MPKPAPRFASRTAVAALAILFAWLACAFWNSVKPLPFGTRTASLPARLGESQVEFLDDRMQHQVTQQRELEFIDRAEQMVVVDQCPIDQDLAQHLLARKRLHPNIKIVVVADPRNEVYGGTPASTLRALETSGIVVARVRLERLRDSNPLYSSAWRLGVSWWDDPFDEVPGEITARSALRRLNFKFDRRQLLVADDGAGSWSSMVTSAAPGGADGGNVGLEVHGQLAREIAGGELQIAAWVDRRRSIAGTAAAREPRRGDYRRTLLDRERDSQRSARCHRDRRQRRLDRPDRPRARRPADPECAAAGRGPRRAPAGAARSGRARESGGGAAELLHDGAGSMEVRWRGSRARGGRFVLIRHGSDAWLNLGSADLTRRSLDDLNLEANLELRMPARAAPARAAADAFAQDWSSAEPYVVHADESDGLYWRYRIAEATGLAMF